MTTLKQVFYLEHFYTILIDDCNHFFKFLDLTLEYKLKRRLPKR